MSTSEEVPRPRRRRIAGERSRPRVPTAEATDAAANRPKPPAPSPRPPAASVGLDKPTRPGWALWLPALVAITVIATVLAAVFGYRASQAQGDPATTAPAKDAVASAADAAETLLSFRFDTLTDELQQEAGLMTPAYAQRFGSTFTAKARARLTEQQVVTRSTVLAAAPVDCGEDCRTDRAQVLVFVDKMTTRGGGEPEYAPDRVIVTMQRDGTVWLVDDVETV